MKAMRSFCCIKGAASKATFRRSPAEINASSTCDVESGSKSISAFTLCIRSNCLRNSNHVISNYHAWRNGFTGTNIKGTNKMNGASTNPPFAINPTANEKGTINDKAITLNRNSPEL